MSLSKTEFDSYAALGFNRIPLMREVLADLDTPLSVYLKLARGPYSYLFESVQGGEKWGRYSIIGLPARTLLRVSGNEVTVEKDGDIIERETAEDPLEYVRRFKARYSVPEIAGLPRFTGGLVGYFGYETIRYIEPRLGAMAKPDAVGAPDILLMVSDEVVVFDNLKGKLYVVIHVNPAVADAFNNANRRLDELVARLGAAHPQPLALHVFPGPRGFSHRRLVPRDPGAPRGRRRHRAPDRGHAPARRDRTGGPGARARAARRSQGARRAHHARGPRTQRRR